MSKTAEKIKLTKYENKFIENYGELFSDIGRSRTQGKIFALLLLRANSDHEGMSQDEIADIVNRSVSTVSRVLNEMTKAGYCTYTEEINNKYRRERKYYIEQGVFEMSLARTKNRLRESRRIVQYMQDLDDQIGEDEREENEKLLQVTANLKETYGIVIDLFEDFIHGLQQHMRDE